MPSAVKFLPVTVQPFVAGAILAEPDSYVSTNKTCELNISHACRNGFSLTHFLFLLGRVLFFLTVFANKA